ncbi:DoxX family protein [Chitinophaga qingshengii]|uniref:DoxX family protein n=1 Tax=Chitinophaga qingshengii TaxID=1569794 RepID=A0ABR7TQF7_9BACT|nr:DoxX family protein [Chitinophaga qingshengii]MBC9932208.1 DoxX family protein [Chitinophaga qingshengii]
MQKDKIIYRAATAGIALISIGGGAGLLFSDFMIRTVTRMGYPGYFRVELAICKIIGGILLWAPVPSQVREWAYAGLLINVISAFLAFAAINGAASQYIWPVVALLLLIISYVCFHKEKRAGTETA